MTQVFRKAIKSHGSPERVFDYCLTSSSSGLVNKDPNDESVCMMIMMEAMIMPNALCVLVVPPTSVELIAKGGPIESFSFTKALIDEDKTNTNKKHKPKISVDNTVVCTTFHKDGSKITLHSPVCGKVLELNERLLESPNMLVDSGFEGYTAVIQPDDKLAKKIKQQV
jgi:hypothetical protein